MPNQFTGSFQEDILTVLCFDKEYAKVVRNLIDLDLFESDYRVVAKEAARFIDQNDGKPPGKSLPTILDYIVDGANKRRARIFTTIIIKLQEIQNDVDGKYIVSRLSKFTKRQSFKRAIIEAVDLLQTDDDEDLQRAEDVVDAMLKERLTSFEAGVRLTQVDEMFDRLENVSKAFPTGIKELDRRNLGPIRKGLHLFIGLPKRGKTWFLINLAKQSFIQTRAKILHVTLEMSEEWMALRYYQALFGVAKRDEEVQITDFELDKLKRVVGLDVRKIRPKLSFDRDDIRKEIQEKVDKWGVRFDRIIIKEFPTGSLTVRQLIGYLDGLESIEGFIPDLMIVDFPDLMTINITQYRLELGNIFKQLRGIAVERNMAVSVVSQGNRPDKDAGPLLTDKNVAEDWSKIGTADTVLTYNQTDMEERLGLARIYVANARHDVSRITILITQNYAMGQFARQSSFMGKEKIYWRMVDEMDDEGREEDG